MIEHIRACNIFDGEPCNCGAEPRTHEGGERVIHQIPSAPEIDWLTRTPNAAWPFLEEGATEVTIPGAHGLVVGPDEILVVVLPQWVGQNDMARHREHFRQVLGDRFVMVMGGDVQLAKVSAGDWAGRAISDRVSVETQQPTARGTCTYCHEPAVFKVVNKGEWWTHEHPSLGAHPHRVVVDPATTVPYSEEK